ncbi:aminotransferase class I/II-fold pyridoxal phosphate-dependent enzyme [Ruminococcus sp.]|uniref:aminotransferase class I/II-fold pyridoxal phosphate-dependent enzyme n=1 Tax=Ruminococcus sp. TaxID=41978 RepID=UPI001B05C75D|nr:aminotransferase class I/II-fold pyridoxal phosphate-dependent enzyme [Ruminococcus sp.]MBO5559407.1 aminotransferase class I/II-fold pyridoxal phosphate-dependent enzyme [Ruminococcus sp.]
MSAPIYEFAKTYSQSGISRFHMPGHKGRHFHGMEALDLTEIRGADYLFEASGVIAESEAQTAKLFGAQKTLYSTEGSSLCIKTMLAIADRCRADHSKRMLVIAPRNVHKAFINACILLDIEVCWVYPALRSRSLCSSGVTADDIARAMEKCTRKADAVYITSPDYLGFIADIREISKVCKSEGVPLIVDDAHGAYLKFLENDTHPMTLGADLCCDSAHKTLSCYTGGAFLHISKDAPAGYAECAKLMMSLFASTSPSYLIMESLDLCSDYLLNGYRSDLAECVKRTALCKKRLNDMGWKTVGEEQCKLTVAAGECGISGDELGDKLRSYSIEPEYTDPDFVVLMTTPFNSEEDYTKLEHALSEIPVSGGRAAEFDEIPSAVVRMPIRQAALSPARTVPVDEAEGCICGMTITSCQPSVPIAVSGEEMTADIIKILKRYGVFSVSVL